MSRVKNFAQSLASGYLLLGANVLYTLASVPLALHYLKTNKFGLWALVSQVAGYLLLIDLGMAGSVSRILVDHKDEKATTTYGSVIQTGFVVLLIQGALIAAGGVLVSFWLPDLMQVPLELRRDFRQLVAGQCILLGVFFPNRMFGHILQAHQRFDVSNYSQIAGLGIGLAVTWAGFALGWGLYSLLVACAAGMIFTTVFTLTAARRLKLLPSRGAWGRPRWNIFKELFFFGTDLFLVSVGFQLTNASQVLILSRTLGLEAAAVWSIATKSFVMAQQLVWHIWTFSASAVSEMIVREERDRLYRRYRDLVVMTASVSVLAGAAIAACNGSFVQVWTKGQIAWNPRNDWLLALLLLVNCTTRCHIGFVGQTKQIRALRYIYFAEGLCFVSLGLLTAPRYGATAVIAAAILMNVLWSGVYGVRRTAAEFREPVLRVAFGWLGAAGRYLALFIPLVGLWCWLVASLPPLPRLALSLAFVSLAGSALLWRYGLTPGLREESAIMAGKLKARLAPG